MLINFIILLVISCQKLFDNNTKSYKQVSNIISMIKAKENTGEILKKIDKIDEKDVSSLNPAIIIPANIGSLDICESLLKKGVCVDFKGKNDETLIIIAVSKNNPALIQLLVRYNADVTIVSKYGKSIVFKAAKSIINSCDERTSYNDQSSDEEIKAFKSILNATLKNFNKLETIAQIVIIKALIISDGLDIEEILNTDKEKFLLVFDAILKFIRSKEANSSNLKQKYIDLIETICQKADTEKTNVLVDRIVYEYNNVNIAIRDLFTKFFKFSFSYNTSIYLFVISFSILFSFNI